jgi:membrane protease YdiL (CAAX protease family)
MNSIYNYNRPILFYFLSTFTSWIFWFIAAYFSHLESYQLLSGWLLLIGLLSPTIVAFTMIYVSNLKKDLLSRLFKVSNVKPLYIFLAFALMPLSILLSQGISLIFGYSIEQFHLSNHASFSFSLFPAWMMLLIAPAIEELAWHSYGTDCLRARFNLFTTCILFAIFWVVWHFPLSFIKGYYHSNIAESSWLYPLNFAISLFPFVFLMNWLYYKSNRNILIAIIFHITAGLFNEIFSTHPDSKVIQTLLLTFFTVALVYKEKDMFFNKLNMRN